MSAKVEMVKTHIEVENQHDMDAMLATLVDEDPVRDEVAGKLYRGVEEVAGRYQALWDAFPNFKVSPYAFIESDNAVAMQAMYTGTHHGTYNGYEPTGNSFELRIVVIFKFQDGKIESETIFLDYASQLRQLGIAEV